MRMNIIFLRVFPFFARREAIKCHPACYSTDLKKRVSYRHFSADCPISWIFVMKEACGLSSLHEMQLLSQMFFLQLSSRKYHVIPREGLWKKRRSKPRAQRFGKVDLEDVDRDDIEAFRDRHQILFLSYVISGTRCPAARILCVRSPGKICIATKRMPTSTPNFPGTPLHSRVSEEIAITRERCTLWHLRVVL